MAKKLGLWNQLNTILSYLKNSNTAPHEYTLQDRDGTLADDTDLALKAPLASPTFTGTPAAPTPAPGTNNTQLANTAFVNPALTAARIFMSQNFY